MIAVESYTTPPSRWDEWLRGTTATMHQAVVYDHFERNVNSPVSFYLVAKRHGERAGSLLLFKISPPVVGAPKWVDSAKRMLWQGAVLC